MMKTYIASLMCILMAGAQFVQAQESMDDVFASLESEIPDAAGTVDASTTPIETVVAAEAAVKSASADDLFERGVALFKAKEYDEAQAAFAAVLSVDSYDKRAMTYLKRVAARISALESKKLNSTRATAISEIDSGWNQDPTVVVDVVAPEVEVDAEDVAAVAALTERIKGIIVPSLDFNDSNIKDVVLVLSSTCRELDKKDGKGVNILLLGVDDSFENSVTISIRDMSLFDVLKYVSEMAELKFDVHANTVVISPINYVAATKMEIRTYKVSPEVGSDLEGAGGAGGDSGGGDLFGEDTFASEEAAGPIDVTGYFTMVKFPEGATAVYHATFQKLVVNNTAENFKDLETILDDVEGEAILRRSQQVEIEAKFVEFNEGALDELGFDWNVYGAGSVLGMAKKPGDYFSKTSGFLANTVAEVLPAGNTLAVDPVTGYAEITPGGGTAQNVYGQNQRDNTTAFSAADGLLSSMGGPVGAMVFGNGDIDLRITAMEQEGSADVLSAPKVTTKSGSEAIIRVAEVHRYPQDWDVETGQRTSPVTKPQDWEDMDLGVTLTVTPVVDSESNTIDLDLHPEIKKFQGFDVYKVGVNAYESGGSELGGAGVILGSGTGLNVSMPYFEIRSVETQVTIADGSTVLMGGLVDERTETFRDQVPFLGDIPYIGRLFRTEGSRSAKKNLVIFVTATQVDDRGMSKKDRESARMTVGN